MRQRDVVVAACVALVVLCLSPTGVRAQSCHGCVDGSQCCGDYPTCCTLVNTTSTVCCAAAETCCQGFCCDADESCCADPVLGGVCCVAQETFCCPSSAQHPNRCCPRWTVCCENDAQDGCCAPEMMGLPNQKPAPGGDDDEADATVAGALARGAQGAVLYVLFLEVDTVYALHVNASSGTILNQIALTGFHNFGEMTRVFSFDGTRTLFHYLEADFLHAPVPGKGRAVTLWTVDPITGLTTNATVTGGVWNLPTAWHYDCASDRILAATQIVTGADERVIGYTFSAIDPTTAHATVLSTLPISGAAGDDADAWAGWFHAVALNGSVAYRNGWRNVTTQQHYGVSITAFAGTADSDRRDAATTATTWWVDGVPLPPNHDFYQSLQVSGGDGQFLSLSPRSSDDGYDLVRWSVVTHTASVVAQFGNAHPPPLFGPVADSVACDATVYVAAVVHDNTVDPDLDRWALAMVDLAHGDALTYLLLDPLMDAKMASISGVGLPQPDAHALCRRRSGARARV